MADQVTVRLRQLLAGELVPVQAQLDELRIERDRLRAALALCEKQIREGIDAYEGHAYAARPTTDSSWYIALCGARQALGLSPWRPEYMEAEEAEPEIRGEG